MTAVRVLEPVLRHAPAGLRFRDVATGQIVQDALQVTLTAKTNALRTARLAVNAKGVWYAPRLPGISESLSGADEAPDAAYWAQQRRIYTVSVTDQRGRFLPLSVELEFPLRGLATWPDWHTLPQELLAPLIDDDGQSPPAPVTCRDALPLFSAAGRALPAPMAEVRCQLERADNGEPAAWALLSASHGGQVRGLAQADQHGRVALFFPYPERPRPTLASSPPAITDFSWNVSFTAYSTLDLSPAKVPDFAKLMKQLEHPRDLFASTLSTPALLPAQVLTLGQRCTLKTSDTPKGPSSSLVMAA